MSNSEREKGHDAEREVAHLLHPVFPEAKRSGVAGQADGDLDHVDPYYLEVRRREALALPAWVDEVKRKCPADKVPLIVFRRSRMEWQVCIRLEDLLPLLELKKIALAEVEAARSGAYPR